MYKSRKVILFFITVFTLLSLFVILQRVIWTNPSNQKNLMATEKIYYLASDYKYGGQALDKAGLSYLEWDRFSKSFISEINFFYSDNVYSIRPLDKENTVIVSVDTSGEIIFYTMIDGNQFSVETNETLDSEELQNLGAVFLNKVDEIYLEFINLKYECIYNVDCQV